ncbi:MAG: bifunctional 2-polyprenyl-6-hydroxyphenol methylase/3-demethylubiquinol 3-O-methyltransferase UbiG, partial [Gammaproteobacteria bacterium]
VDYRQATAESWAAEHPAQYDIVTCMEMLEHVPDPAAVVQACATLVRPGGQVFFSTINRNLKAFVLAVIGAEYLLRLIPRGTHEYAKFIRPSELAGWARHAGLDLRHSTGVHYEPLSRRYRLGGNVDVNYILHCTRTD